MKLAKEAGAKRALPLAVSAPSHCALMISASDRLETLLNTIEMGEPAVPLVNNADAMFLVNAGKIKISLIKQLNSPLLWEDSIRNIVNKGVGTFIEVGPGKVLSGLIKRIEPEAKILNVEDMASLEKTLQLFKDEG
ncbi:Malonyl CoA-acyl carrier protein transacylase (fragment) [Candidatus Sulfobium mesophilum]|uniref:[acyl-carrier-protein] S-malonyltransferase n=1 Tax=Candidatus Sulfobium mesophilum TaxID=2016548 RepID=A0A2U3QK07_9BACT